MTAKKDKTKELISIMLELAKKMDENTKPTDNTDKFHIPHKNIHNKYNFRNVFQEASHNRKDDDKHQKNDLSDLENSINVYEKYGIRHIRSMKAHSDSFNNYTINFNRNSAFILAENKKKFTNFKYKEFNWTLHEYSCNSTMSKPEIIKSRPLHPNQWTFQEYIHEPKNTILRTQVWSKNYQHNFYYKKFIFGKDEQYLSSSIPNKLKQKEHFKKQSLLSLSSMSNIRNSERKYKSVFEKTIRCNDNFIDYQKTNNSCFMDDYNVKHDDKKFGNTNQFKFQKNININENHQSNPFKTCHFRLRSGKNEKDNFLQNIEKIPILSTYQDIESRYNRKQHQISFDNCYQCKKLDQNQIIKRKKPNFQ